MLRGLFFLFSARMFGTMRFDAQPEIKGVINALCQFMLHLFWCFWFAKRSERCAKVSYFVRDEAFQFGCLSVHRSWLDMAILLCMHRWISYIDL
jgi:hypothetical protein